MRGILLLLVLVAGCGKTSIDGETDAQDSLDDHDGADTSCGDCDDRDPCTVDTCNPLTAECEHTPLDADDDGYIAIESPDGTECGGDDCDDSDPDVYPGAPEVCLDGVDQDCDGQVDGILVSTDLLLISDGPNDARHPDIAWTASSFGVVWQEDLDELTRIRFTSINADGTSVGEKSWVSELDGFADKPRIAWSGSNFGVTWVNMRTSLPEGMFFTRIDGSGLLLDGETSLTSHDRAVTNPDIIWSGSEFGVVWQEGSSEGYYKIVFTRVSETGIEIGDDLFVADIVPERYCWGSENPAIAWTGSQYGIVWFHNQHMVAPRDLWYYLYYSALDPEGGIVFENVFVSDYCCNNTFAPSIVWSGENLGLSWNQGGDIHFALLNPSGDVIREPILLADTSSFQSSPAVIWNTKDFLIFFSKEDGFDPYSQDIYIAGVTPGGAVSGEEMRLTWNYGLSIGPRLAWTGSEIGAVWEDDGYDQWSVVFARIQFCD